MEDLKQSTSDLNELNELLDELKIRNLHADMSRYNTDCFVLSGHKLNEFIVSFVVQRLSVDYDELKQKVNATDDQISGHAEQKTLIE